MPAASSAIVDAMTRLISRTVWLAMKAADSSGTAACHLAQLKVKSRSYEWVRMKPGPGGLSAFVLQYVKRPPPPRGRRQVSSLRDSWQPASLTVACNSDGSARLSVRAQHNG